MRVVPFLISAGICTALIFCLDKSWGIIPPLGRFLSPQHGFWQNAERADEDLSEDLLLTGMQDKGTAYLDDRLVPHIFAQNDADAYYIQGYIHARFRLWQMEWQVFAAAGRISELIGPRAINFDREKRRLGMIYAAERSLQVVEQDSVCKAECDAYTAGVNAYIDGLKETELPLEYKLLNYRPERWNNLKTALFLKYMSLELAGNEHDFEYSNALRAFGLANFEKMYPDVQDSLVPIVPRDTSAHLHPGIAVRMPAGADSSYLHARDSVTLQPQREDPDNGSNNWAVSGKKTRSGFPILCNDPHLGLNLPSLWFEVQLTTPNLNAYGVSFPGAPGVIIGFNDSCAFGFTSAERDVRDYYELRFRDDSMQEYWYNGEWRPTEFRYEHILIRGQAEFIDTVAYTVWGPVMYDRKFAGGRTTHGKYYAVRWKAHDPSNELLVFHGLDRARNYSDYLDAIRNLHTPGQNCIFASKSGDIAIWAQGEFPAKWKHQGDFIMPGDDSSYRWQGMIPQEENPYLKNPDRGFVSSANQEPVDPASYPYYLGTGYPLYRGIIINRLLSQLSGIVPEDMMKLQTDTYDVFAEMARPILLQHIDPGALSGDELALVDTLQSWDLRDDAGEHGPTLFTLLWDNLESVVWNDELHAAGAPVVRPAESTLLEGILKDSTYPFLDNINTAKKETLRDDVTEAFKRAAAAYQRLDRSGRSGWAAYKDAQVGHLARIPAFSREHLVAGGGTHCINAIKSDHGPSWRMIVGLSPQTEAYGIYPGGQSGNPGSPYYDNFIGDWAEGKYYPLWVMQESQAEDKRIIARLTFHR
jgi:penicillin amidase